MWFQNTKRELITAVGEPNQLQVRNRIRRFCELCELIMLNRVELNTHAHTQQCIDDDD